jgi:hypothetical protein
VRWQPGAAASTATGEGINRRLSVDCVRVAWSHTPEPSATEGTSLGQFLEAVGLHVKQLLANPFLPLFSAAKLRQKQRRPLGQVCRKWLLLCDAVRISHKELTVLTKLNWELRSENNATAYETPRKVGRTCKDKHSSPHRLVMAVLTERAQAAEVGWYAGLVGVPELAEEEVPGTDRRKLSPSRQLLYRGHGPGSSASVYLCFTELPNHCRLPSVEIVVFPSLSLVVNKAAVIRPTLSPAARSPKQRASGNEGSKCLARVGEPANIDHAQVPQNQHPEVARTIKKTACLRRNQT